MAIYKLCQYQPIDKMSFNDFMTGLLVLTNCKNKTYDFIPVILDQFTKMAYYKPVMITINTLKVVKVFLNVII